MISCVLIAKKKREKERKAAEEETKRKKKAVVLEDSCYDHEETKHFACLPCSYSFTKKTRQNVAICSKCGKKCALEKI